MQTGSVGSIHEYWEGSEVEDVVVTTTLLSDINQPYSCQQWSNLAPGEGGTIIHDTGYRSVELQREKNINKIPF